MRIAAWRIRLPAWAVLALLGTACGSPPPAPPSPPAATGTYEITAPAFSLRSGQERTVCYYTRLPNPNAIGVKRFVSSMSPGSHHLILYTTGEATQPDGTLKDCGLLVGTLGQTSTRVPIWTYAAQEPDTELVMPEGVGMKLDANQPVILQMHYLNPSPQALQPSATLRLEVLEGNDWEQARPFVTYDTQIRVGPLQAGEVSGECVVPTGAKFFLMSTHSHRFTTRVRAFDGDQLLVDTSDWEHPAVSEWRSEPYHQFQSGYLRYHCEYQNPTDRTVRTGDSAETDEMCMAVGYFFPATRQRFCVDGFVLPF